MTDENVNVESAIESTENLGELGEQPVQSELKIDKTLSTDDAASLFSGKKTRKDIMQPEEKDNDQIKAQVEDEASKNEEEQEDDNNQGEIDNNSEDDKQEDVDVEDLEDNPTVSIKVNGEMRDVSLDDLISSYSEYETNKEINRDFEERETKFTERQQQLDKFHKEASDHVVALGKKLLEQVQTDNRFSNEEMNRLREEDPVEWTARKEELRTKQELIRESDHQYKLRQQEEQRQAEEHYNNYAKGQAEKLVSKYKDFSDEKVMTEKLGEVGKYLTSNYDFTKEEVEGLVRADMFDIAIKAMKYDQTKSNIKDFAKKVKESPKLIKPIARKDVSTKNDLQRQIANKTQQLKRSGSQQTAGELLILKKQLRALNN